MTDQELNIKIAELCGWKHTSQEVWKSGGPHHIIDKSRTWDEYIPNYADSLDESYALYWSLTESERMHYIQNLFEIAVPEDVRDCNELIWDHMAFATPKQRALAFLKTMTTTDTSKL